MNTSRLKPEKKIDELLLLVTIRNYTRERMWPPTAADLFEFKLQFAPSLSRIDTLRMWLRRHTGRSVRRVKGCRPFRYELTRQGERRIPYLTKRAALLADFRRRLDDAVERQKTINIIQQLLVAQEIEKREQERKMLLIRLIAILERNKK